MSRTKTSLKVGKEGDESGSAWSSYLERRKGEEAGWSVGADVQRKGAAAVLVDELLDVNVVEVVPARPPGGVWCVAGEKGSAVVREGHAEHVFVVCISTLTHQTPVM